MAGEAVLAGGVAAVRNALASCDSWAPLGLDLSGAVIIGDGDADLPTVRRLPTWERLDLAGLSARWLILAEPPQHGAEARVILERAANAQKKVMVVEGGRARRLRLDDLVGRPLGQIDEARIRSMIAGKRVLITGGGGSIGAQLARRIAGLSPARLTLLDSSEYNLFRIGLELPNATPALADIRDVSAMRRWFAREKPQIVFHAAALKQVPLVERFASEGVLTNVGGLRNVAEAAREVGADLVFVSTDKAVEPSSVMGATKRLGELYVHALDRRGPQRAIAVRLGNVLGSTGSVTPTFEAQLANGGPLTVTDPDVTRFFLSIPQSADALLQAAAVGLGLPLRGPSFVIEMGEALSVVELAREVIRLEGKRPELDVPIVFTGLRPGEKLHELLIGADEWREADPAPNVTAVASTPRGLGELHEVMERLCMLAREGADDAVIHALFTAIIPQKAADIVAEDRALTG